MSFYDEYDDELEDRQKGQTDLDRHFAQREAELAQKEAELAEREREAMTFYHNSEAKAAADAAKWRHVQQQITPDMNGEDILRLYRANGI
jgi:hypothetical protein